MITATIKKVENGFGYYDESGSLIAVCPTFHGLFTSEGIIRGLGSEEAISYLLKTDYRSFMGDFLVVDLARADLETVLNVAGGIGSGFYIFDTYSHQISILYSSIKVLNKGERVLKISDDYLIKVDKEGNILEEYKNLYGKISYYETLLELSDTLYSNPFIRSVHLNKYTEEEINLIISNPEAGRQLLSLHSPWT